MKRFTETEKWRDPWFQKLDRESRILWVWLCDRVDNAGVVDICWPICNAETGGSFSEDSMASLGDKVERLETGKWWIPKFVHFQFGELSEQSKVHQSVEKLLKKHTLSHRVSHRVCNTLKEKDKEKDKDKDKEKTNGSHVISPEVFMESVKSNPAYNHINLQSELGKMDMWIKTHPGRKKTMRFVLNWLNKIEVPLSASAVKKYPSFEEYQQREGGVK